jgi:hypothetical protein
MTEKGCIGKLALEGTGKWTKTCKLLFTDLCLCLDNSTTVLQLLGLFDIKESNIKSTFNKR